LYPEVSLVVSDNASPDETKSVLESFRGISPRVHLRTLNSNVGGNANALLGFSSELPSQYIWILSDDDPINDHAIENILRALKPSPDLLTVQFPGYEADSGIFSIQESGITPVLQGKGWGLFSAVIYSRNLVKNSIQVGFSYHDSSFPHLAILFDACWKTPTGVSVRSIEKSEVFATEEPGVTKSKGDYSLSLTGGASLYHLAKDSEKAKLARSWAWSNSVGAASFRRRHPLAYNASRSFIRTHGGIRGEIYLQMGLVIYHLQKSNLGKRLQSFVMNRPAVKRLFMRLGINFFDLGRYYLE
jgi:glycosyltransferase involved in cell wall biosynthesis